MFIIYYTASLEEIEKAGNKFLHGQTVPVAYTSRDNEKVKYNLNMQGIDTIIIIVHALI